MRNKQRGFVFDVLAGLFFKWLMYIFILAFILAIFKSTIAGILGLGLVSPASSRQPLTVNVKSIGTVIGFFNGVWVLSHEASVETAGGVLNFV